MPLNFDTDSKVDLDTDSKVDLVDRPPRERPSASPAILATPAVCLPVGQNTAPPFPGASGMLVRPDHRGVHRDAPLNQLAVVSYLRCGQDPVPGPVRGPPARPLTGAGLPRPVPLWQVPPRRTRPRVPQNRVHANPACVNMRELRHARLRVPRLPAPVGEVGAGGQGFRVLGSLRVVDETKLAPAVVPAAQRRPSRRTASGTLDRQPAPPRSP